MLLKNIPAQLWLLLLCAGWFYLPLDSFISYDNAILLKLFGSPKNIWAATTIALQWAFVISCYILSRSRWCAAIIIIEVFCMAYNVAACYATGALRDTIYDSRPLIVWLAFILQLTAIAISTGGGVGSHDNYNRRKSDPANNSDSDLHRSQSLFGRSGLVEAQK